MTVRQWADKHKIKNSDITGHRDDMMSFCKFVEFGDNSRLSPKEMVHAFNHLRPFIMRVDYRGE